MTVQESFFKALKEKRRGGPQNLAQEIAELLNVSETSAYRRISGETPLTIDELVKFASYYKLSIDGLLDLQNNSNKLVDFSWQYQNTKEDSYESFLNWLLSDLNNLDTSASQALFHAKDFPVFFNFVFPEIAAFKSFFWQKAFLHLHSFRSQKFSCKNLNENHITLGKAILKRYTEIDSKELWNDDIFNSVLRQVEYCYEAGYFHSNQDVITILDKLESLVYLFEEMAEKGYKFLPDEETLTGKFDLYHNQVILGDNSMVISENGSMKVYISQNIIQGLVTSEKTFVENSFLMKTNLINHSLLLSNSGQKERTRFFQKLHLQVKNTRSFLHL